MLTRLFIVAAAFALLLAPNLHKAPETHAAEYVFETQMFGREVVPPVDTVGWGFFRFFFNEDRSAADITIDLKGLAGEVVISADIHRGAPGSNGPVVKHLADGGYIVTAAHVRFTKAELQEMNAGSWYISLKTTNHPDGELRGQIRPPADFLPSPPAPPAPVNEAPPPAQVPPAGLVITPPNTGDAGLASK